jgi:hypothetical protein
MSRSDAASASAVRWSISTTQQQTITTTARFMACETAERNPGRNDRFEIGSIDWKFGMRRMACTRFQLCSFVPETIACSLRKQHISYGVERLTRAKSPHSASRELKPSSPARG